MAIAPDGRDLYVVDTASNKLVVIDAESNLIQKQIRVGSSPDQLVVTPNSSYIFVVSGSNRLVRVSANADAVTGSTALPIVGVVDLAVSNGQEGTVTAFSVLTDRAQWVASVPGTSGPLALGANSKDLFLLGD